MNGSPTAPIGRASRPASIGSCHRSSVKFWLKLFDRRIVQPTPDAATARSASAIPCPNRPPVWSSPRPDNTTNRSTPAATACLTNGSIGAGSSGATR